MQVGKHLQGVNFTLPSGERVYFDENGDPAATYDLVNWQRNKAGEIIFDAVGSYDASQPNGRQFIMNRKNITWAGDFLEVTEGWNWKFHRAFVPKTVRVTFV